MTIDPEGRTAHRWKRANARGHSAEVRQRLEKLQAEGWVIGRFRFVQQ